MTTVTVFCGASAGKNPQHRDRAAQLGRCLVAHEVTVVYGAGAVGLMGSLADSVLDAGGKLIGVIPASLFERGLAHPKVLDLRVTPGLHERKALMAQLADAFIALPGGFGTLDELFEVAAWRQLGLHRRPLGLLNSDGFFTPLLAYLDHAVTEGFLAPQDRALIAEGAEASVLVPKLLSMANL